MLTINQIMDSWVNAVELSIYNLDNLSHEQIDQNQTREQIDRDNKIAIVLQSLETFDGAHNFNNHINPQNFVHASGTVNTCGNYHAMLRSPTLTLELLPSSQNQNYTVKIAYK